MKNLLSRVVALSCLTALRLSAQDATVHLDPFSVSADQDRGYAATSTLSGTRLNTSLADTAAAVSVIMPDMMQDLGLHDVNQIASFMLNTEVDPNSANAAFNVEQNNASAIRVRGLTSNAAQANFFSIPWAIDSYNIDRITATRGPNSLLFGVGNSEGSLSSTTKSASVTADRVSGSTQLTFDQHQTRREEMDVDIPLVPKRAAIRLAGFDDERRDFLAYDDRHERRLFITGTAVLADFSNYRAKVTAQEEWGHALRDLPDQTTLYDGITPWLAAGRPTVPGTASAGNAANLPAGTTRAASAATLISIDGSPTAIPAMNWINTAHGALLSTTQSYRLGPAAPVPADINYKGPAVASNFSGRVFQAFLEQTFFNNLAVELGSSRTQLSLPWVRTSGFEMDVDTNQNLPNGQSNPNVGKFYTQGTYRLQQEHRTTAEDRATVAYQFDGNRYSPWLGSWMFSGLVNRQNMTQGLDDSFEYNLTPLAGFSTSPSSAQNRIVRRTYLFEGAEAWLPTAYYGQNLPPVTAPGVTAGLRNTRVVNSLTSDEGWTLGTQGKFLNDHLVLTLGQRHDEVKLYSATPAANADGFFNHWSTYGRPLIGEYSGNTRTFGALVHLAHWLSAFYDQSNSIDVGQPRLDIFGNPLPVPSGKGRDAGLKVSLFENRLNLTLSTYRSGAINQPTNPDSGLPNNVGLIEDATGLKLNVENRSEQPPDTEDNVSRGYEFELTYNPTDAWRIAVNASRNLSVLSNVNLRYTDFLQQRIFPIETTSGSVATANGQTVQTLIEQMRLQAETFHNAAEGAPANELRKWSWNVITNYSITHGWLRGLSYGGSAQYRSPNVLGLRLDSSGLPQPGQQILGDQLWTFGAMMRYEHKLRGHVRWSAQLNAFNLFNDRLFVRKAADPVTGATTGWGLRQPRTIQASTGLTF